MSGIELDNINSEWIGASARCPCMHLVCMYMYAEFLLHAHAVLCRCLFHGSTHLYIPGHICISVSWHVCMLIRQYVSVLLQIQESKASRMTWTSKKLAGE